METRFDRAEAERKFWAEAAYDRRETSGYDEPLHSAHEAYAVLQQHLDEFWELVKDNRDPWALRHELLNIAAACAQTVLDLRLPSEMPEGG